MATGAVRGNNSSNESAAIHETCDKECIPMEDVQYHESHHVTTVPIKTGDDLENSDALMERPTSAGTIYSSVADFDDLIDDDAILAENAIARRKEAADGQSRSVGELAYPADPDSAHSLGSAANKQTQPQSHQAEPEETQHSRAHVAVLADPGPQVTQEPRQASKQSYPNVQATKHTDRPLSGCVRRKNRKQAGFIPLPMIIRGFKPLVPHLELRSRTPAHHLADLGTIVGPSGSSSATEPPQTAVACAARPPDALPRQQQAHKPEDQASRQVQDEFRSATPDVRPMIGEYGAGVSDVTDATIPPKLNSPKPSHWLKSVQRPTPLTTIGPACDRVLPAVASTKRSRPVAKPANHAGSPQSLLAQEKQHQPVTMTLAHTLVDTLLKEDQKRVEQVNALMQEIEEQVQRAANEKQRAIDQLGDALQKNTELKDKIDKDRKTICKVHKFKFFVDELGNDFNRLTQAEHRRQSNIESLRQTYDSDELERERLHYTLLRALEQTGALKKKAVDLCHELQAEQVKAAAEIKQLSTQLGERSSMLETERSRRSELEKQVSEATRTQAEMLGIVKTNSAAILEKVVSVHGELEKHRPGLVLHDVITQMSSAVDGIQTGSKDTQEAMASVKSLVEAFTEKLDEHINSNIADAEDSHSTAVKALQAHMDDALKKLKQDLVTGEEMLKRETEHRESISALKEQLAASATQSHDLESQLKTAQQAGQHLQQQNDSLQTKLTSLQAGASQADDDQVNLEQIPDELNASKGEVTEAQANLASKCEELRILNETHTQLKGEFQALQVRLDGYDTQIADFDREREELTSKAEQIEQSVRKQMQEHLDQVEVQLRAETRNDLKKVSSERNRLQERISTLHEDLQTAKAKVQEGQQYRSQGMSTTQELEKLRNDARSQILEIGMLKASLIDLRKAEDSAKKEAATLTERLKAEQSKGQTAVNENSRLSEQTDRLHRTLMDAKLLEAKYKSACSEKEASIQELENQLSEAREKAKHAEAGLQLYKATSDEALTKAEEEGQRKIGDLQKALNERQKELAQVNAESEKFHADVDETWRKEQSEHQGHITKLLHQLAEAKSEAERQRNNAQAATETEQNKLQCQIGEMRKRAEAAESRLKDFHATRGPDNVVLPGATRDDTAPDSVESIPPTRPRQRVDRSTDQGEVVPNLPSGVPPPDSQRDNSAGNRLQRDQSHEPSQVVQESMAENRPTTQRSARSSLSPGIADTLRIQQSDLLRPAPVVEETQLRDQSAMLHNAGLPLSQDIADILTIQPIELLRPAPVDEETQYRDRVPLVPQNTSALTGYYTESETTPFQSQYFTTRSSQRDPCFSIYEDSQDYEGPLNTQSVLDYGKLEDTIGWSQAERDMYTFQKPVANPNSASKRVPSYDHVRNTTGRSVSQGSRGDRYRPETPRAVNDSQGGTFNRMNSNTSSSPGFVRDSQASGRKMSTYQSQSYSGNKRMSSRNDSNTTADPRLASRNLPAPSQKRRASDQTVDGSRGPSKKRTKSGVLCGGALSSSQAFDTSQAVAPSSSAAPYSSSLYGRSAPRRSSHMRTLAGSNTRVTRSKMLKNDEVNARFSQELYRR